MADTPTQTPAEPVKRTRRERPKAIQLTDAAAERIREIMENSDQDMKGLRIGVRNGGCAGMAYTMDYVAEPEALDETVEDKGVTVFIDSKAVLFLIGTTLDFKTDKLSAQFVFENPNQVDACGCGESVNLKPFEIA